MCGWKIFKWGEIAKLEYGKSLRDYRFSGGKVPVFGTNGPVGFTSKPLCNYPSVIIGRKGAYRGVHYSSVPFFVIDTAFYLVPDKEKVDPKFAYYSLILQDINGLDSGSAIPSTRREDFYELEVALPDLPTQHRIASILSALDDKIELNRQMNQTLEQMAQTLFRQYFVEPLTLVNQSESALSPSEHENVQLGSLTAEVAFTPANREENGITLQEAKNLPSGWKLEKLGNVCNIFRGASPRPITDPKYFSNGTIPWIKIADATAESSIYINSTKEYCTELAISKSRFLKKGSLILSNSATVGIPKILNLDGCIHDGWLSFNQFNGITRNFLFYILTFKLKEFNQIATGSVQNNLNTALLKETTFYLPPFELVQKFDLQCQLLFDKILNCEIESITLKNLRDTLLPKLMSGEINVLQAAKTGAYEPEQVLS